MINNELLKYVTKFNLNDDETVINLISNDSAYEFLKENAPILTCPDKTIEETFAFRCWVYRKHIKQTEDGIVITEFLPKVPWAGKHNTINAPLFFHLNEGRWFPFANKILEYANFFLTGKGRSHFYTTPALTSIVNIYKNCDKIEYLLDNVDLAEQYYLGWNSRLLQNGLYYNSDNIDAMEISINGNSVNLETRYEGIRPTFNTYMYIDTVTLANLFKAVNNNEKYEYYIKRANELKLLINERLWDGDFYKCAYAEKVEDLHGDIDYTSLKPENNARELIGFLPFKTDIPKEEYYSALKYLFDDKHFLAPNGFTTADISHPRFLFDAIYECRWNGFVWPFATSQTIEMMIYNVKKFGEKYFTYNNIYSAIKTYASIHYKTDSGKTVNWIDEDYHPYKNEWSAREKLISRYNNGEDFSKLYSYDRGKDYNHSSFIDLVVRGLIGVDEDAETLTVSPTILDKWDYFRLENLNFKGKTYTITYDKYGNVFDCGKGLSIKLQ